MAAVKWVYFFTPANPSIFVDVSGVYDHKVAACLAHRSQFPEGEKNLEWMRDLDRAAARRSTGNMEYAEQFETAAEADAGHAEEKVAVSQK